MSQGSLLALGALLWNYQQCGLGDSGDATRDGLFFLPYSIG